MNVNGLLLYVWSRSMCKNKQGSILTVTFWRENECAQIPFPFGMLPRLGCNSFHNFIAVPGGQVEVVTCSRSMFHNFVSSYLWSSVLKISFSILTVIVISK